MRRLFPAGVLAAEMREAGDPAMLLPAEARHVATAAATRREEFAAGRLCARRLLAEFGVHGFALTAAEDRQPLWPDSMVGSITHTTGFCAAVAAGKKQVQALGLDSEIMGAVKPELWPSICTSGEIDWIRSLPQAQQSRAATVIFSAKEAFYKCQYPLTGERLWFHDAGVAVPQWSPGGGTFIVSANRRIAFAQHATLPMHGRYISHEEFVTAGVALAWPRPGVADSGTRLGRLNTPCRRETL